MQQWMMEKVVQRSDPRELLSLVCGGGFYVISFPGWYGISSLAFMAMQWGVFSVDCASVLQTLAPCDGVFVPTFTTKHWQRHETS